MCVITHTFKNSSLRRGGTTFDYSRIIMALYSPVLVDTFRKRQFLLMFFLIVFILLIVVLLSVLGGPEQLIVSNPAGGVGTGIKLPVLYCFLKIVANLNIKTSTCTHNATSALLPWSIPNCWQRNFQILINF